MEPQNSWSAFPGVVVPKVFGPSPVGCSAPGIPVHFCFFYCPIEDKECHRKHQIQQLAFFPVKRKGKNCGPLSDLFFKAYSHLFQNEQLPKSPCWSTRGVAIEHVHECQIQITQKLNVLIFVL